MTKLRLAIVGAGPAGIYAADILLKAERKFDVSIDLFDQLPAPYGLVRYGVAPDHPRIKQIILALHKILERGDIRLLCNVDVGTDVTLEELRRHYDAVIFATGAIKDAALPIPGIDLPGSYGAADFVSWYDGHPDVPREWPLEAEQIAIIGAGNVALDVARILAKHADDLLPTPDFVASPGPIAIPTRAPAALATATRSCAGQACGATLMSPKRTPSRSIQCALDAPLTRGAESAGASVATTTKRPGSVSPRVRAAASWRSGAVTPSRMSSAAASRAFSSQRPSAPTTSVCASAAAVDNPSRIDQSAAPRPW